MPEIDENLKAWAETYDWSTGGEEWSEHWGGVSYQWWVTLFPRIQGFVPVRRMLEIAPGYGRWTHFLRELCGEILIVDLSETCVEHCRQRFADDPRVRAFANDGTSLAMIEDDSIDFAFSFDSLVHVEQSVIDAYLSQLGTKLTHTGVAFLHHSNLGSYTAADYADEQVHWRAPSVSAASFEASAEAAGLRCVSQEKIVWGGGKLLLDCISVVARPGTRWEREKATLDNWGFTSEEMRIARQHAALYPPSRRDVAFKAVPPPPPST